MPEWGRLVDRMLACWNRADMEGWAGALDQAPAGLHDS